MTPSPDKSGAAPLWLLLLLQAGISAAGLVVEIVAGRMIAPYVGMSLYTWTSIIAVVLAGFSVGHWWGGRLAVLESGPALRRAGWIMIAAAVFTAAATLVLRIAAEPVLGSITNPLAAITMIAALAFFLPSLFAGVPAPVLAVVAMRHTTQSERALGAMFAAGAAGAIVGTLLAGFLFVSWLGSVGTLTVIALFYTLAATLCFRLGGLAGRQILLAVAAATVALLAGLRALALPSVCDVESSYYCIRTVPLADDPNAPVNLMVIDHLAHGINAREAPRVMFTDHTAMLDALPRMRMGRDDFTSFHIGGGSYSVPRAWADRGASTIMVAEIDPSVTRVAMRDFWFDPETAAVTHKDGRVALRESGRAFDVIVGDAFTDIAVPAHLVTEEFFRLVAERLEKGGVFAMNVIDNVDRLDALAALVVTLSNVFPSVEVWTEARGPEPGERRVFVLLAGDAASPVSEIAARTPEPKRFAALEQGFLDDIIARTGARVLTDDHAPIDRLMGLGPLLD
ncbi:fused MFS/spermidine synthase [Sedimentitalea sp. JM2-8]|uniref:Fused MFS/spermidine synthase n=1 Tax=Sedimentitalea xiamensis TaxID=3050037 RepID=A0ABT7FJQ3_9RHOB|nr:fused MFS/spermidine synthase [Sedimentitalea xiamensis]MDK3075327.1 fused MFS/spermidine synthase [Sedimentitalea xiamensis]